MTNTSQSTCRSGARPCWTNWGQYWYNSHGFCVVCHQYGKTKIIKYTVLEGYNCLYNSTTFWISATQISHKNTSVSKHLQKHYLTLVTVSKVV